ALVVGDAEPDAVRRRVAAAAAGAAAGATLAVESGLPGRMDARAGAAVTAVADIQELGGEQQAVSARDAMLGRVRAALADGAAAGRAGAAGDVGASARPVRLLL